MRQKLIAVLIAALSLPSASIARVGAQADSRPRPPAGGPGLPGIWRVEARLPAGLIEAFVEIDRGSGPELPARITAVKLGVRRIPAAKAASRDGVVVLDIPLLGGKYRGTLSEDGNHIAGMIETRAGPMMLGFDRVSGLPPRSQEPARPYSYRDEEVSFQGDPGGIRFHGTLTIPKRPGRHPAVVMISGGGCEDRDSTIGDQRPFLVIADHLTRRGIAVLRCDDRGFGMTGGNVLDATGEDFATDALAAVAFLAGRSDVDSSKIGLVGHGEGAIAAMIAASRSRAVRFVVSLAGVAEKCDRFAYANLLTAAGIGSLDPSKQAGAREAIWRVTELLKSGASDAEVAHQLGAFLPREVVPALACRWTRFLVRCDPAQAIEKVSCPILALFGAEDAQVAPRENAEALRAAAARGGNGDVTVVTMPRLGHLLQLAAPTIADGVRCDETVAPEALDRTASWILERTGRSRAAESR